MILLYIVVLRFVTVTAGAAAAMCVNNSIEKYNGKIPGKAKNNFIWREDGEVGKPLKRKRRKFAKKQ